MIFVSKKGCFLKGKYYGFQYHVKRSTGKESFGYERNQDSSNCNIASSIWDHSAEQAGFLITAPLKSTWHPQVKCVCHIKEKNYIFQISTLSFNRYNTDFLSSDKDICYWISWRQLLNFIFVTFLPYRGLVATSQL